jgi:hypothetical protein
MKWEDLSLGMWLSRKSAMNISRVLGISDDAVLIVPVKNQEMVITLTKEKFESFEFESVAFYVKNGRFFWEKPNGMQIDAGPEFHTGVPYSLSLLNSKYFIFNNKSTNTEPLMSVSDFGMESICTHEWKPTQLFFKTVYDCSKCGIKKEDA